jgi:hypothetical protein
MFTPSSLATLKTAIDAAQDVLDDHFINVTKTEADPLAAAIETTALDVLMCTLTFNAVDGVVNVNGGAAVNSYVAEKNTTVELNAIPMSGYEFEYWQDSGGNIIGTASSIDYTVSRTTAITAVFRGNSAYTFTYQDNYGKIYKIQTASDFSEVSYPYAVGSTDMRVGLEVLSWADDYPGGVPASGAVDANVVFTANLKRVDGESFTVSYKNNQDESSWQTQVLKAGYVFEKTAADSYGGNDFSCWKDSAGNVLTYGKTIKISVYSDMFVYPWYDGAKTGLTTAVLQAPIVSSGKISFPGQIVEGSDLGSLVYCGVLMLQSNTAVTDLTFDTPGVIVGKANSVSALTKSFIINKKNVVSGDTWYGRAFAVYYSGNDLTIAYSDIKSATAQ